MNKKLFVKRLSISVLCILAPFVGVWATIVFTHWFGSAGISLSLFLLCLGIFWRDVKRFLETTIEVAKEVFVLYINWLKGNDGKPD